MTDPRLLTLLRHADQRPARKESEIFTLGCDDVDAALGGGLERYTLHEVFAAESGDIASATTFTLALMARAAPPRSALLWARQGLLKNETGQVYGPGLADHGFEPSRFVLVDAHDPVTLLKAGSDALRSAAFGAVLIDLWGAPKALDLTATRRLLLSAETAGTGVFLLRAGASPQASAATTRWSIASAPSRPLEANAPGHPVFAVTLLRHRGGIPSQSWHLEWSREDRLFHLAAPLPGALVPLPAERPPAAQSKTQKFSNLRRA